MIPVSTPVLLWKNPRMLTKVVFTIGIALGALVASPIAYIIGDWTGGWKEAAVNEVRAELIQAQSQRDAAFKDLEVARTISYQKEQDSEENRQRAASAEERLRGYVETLQSKPGCGFDDNDIKWLRSRGSSGSIDQKPTSGEPGSGSSGTSTNPSKG